ncbi:IS66 family insertion sequence element accessory protein TnpA [Tahibacter amnicola]|uniref:Transposase n=1 Tax=Tahibacter amnicola TaxID=2976241 RepID=A0ABY6BES2_9GAMM|nr:hypothetical protein [Tahibacter amnicola]UXI68543.1 hypothetical protein N4264_02495 [Tahibacter amnicola]
MQSAKTKQFWQRHVDGWRSSGLTQKQYSQKHGVNALTLAQWSHRLKRDRTEVPGRALVPVRVVGEVSPAPIQVQHGAWRISVPVGTDTHWLATLMREIVAC